MNSTFHTVMLILLFAAGGVLTYMAQRFEEGNKLAKVHLFTPNQWLEAPAPPEVRTLRSPALTQRGIPMEGEIPMEREIPLEGGILMGGGISMDSALRSSDSLMRALLNIPVLPVDTLRWRLWNECCGFDLRYPVRLQSRALLQTIVRHGGAEWAVVVPEGHLSTWRRILGDNSQIELYPKM